MIMIERGGVGVNVEEKEDKKEMENVVDNVEKDLNDILNGFMTIDPRLCSTPMVEKRCSVKYTQFPQRMNSKVRYLQEKKEKIQIEKRERKILMEISEKAIDKEKRRSRTGSLLRTNSLPVFKK